MPGLIFRKMFEWPRLMGLPARFQTATASFQEQLDQVPHLLIFLGSKTLLKCAKPPVDSLHRLPCFFLTSGAGRSTSSDTELVTTFSGEKNWSIIATGLLVVLVGMMLVFN
jgi:hypothetical protein